MMHNPQALFEHDDGSRILCHINCGSYRDTDISSVERRSIIDAITEEADDVASVLERKDDAILLRWRDSGEDIGLLCYMCQSGIAHMIKLISQYDTISRQAYLL